MSQLCRLVFISLTACQVLMFSTACGLPPPKCPCAIELVDDPAALTDGPKDKLFTLTYSQGGDSFYVVTPSETQTDMVFYETAAGDKGSLDCTFRDVNKNGGKVDVGDTFACVESDAKKWGTAEIGQPITIVLRAKQMELINSGQRGSVEIARGVWTPN